MAFKVLGDARDAEQIWVVTDIEATITDVERQDKLFTAGFHFEAAMAQAAMAEGLLLHYMLAGKQVRGITLRAQTEERFLEERITFGQVKDELIKVNGFHDPDLSEQVSDYVSDRNKIARHLCSGKHEFDSAGF